MNSILFDGPERNDLLPFTFTRPVAELRIGILTLREKWERALNENTSTQTETYLSEKWPMDLAEENLFVNPAFLPSAELVTQINDLRPEEKLVCKGNPIAFLSHANNDISLGERKSIEVETPPLHIAYTWDLFAKNGEAIAQDFDRLTEGRISAGLNDTVTTINKEQIFIEEDAQVNYASLNASNGPIYIGKDAEIMEGAHIRGPLALCDSAVVKMGAKIYGPTTIGPHSKVGGEVNNSVIIGYSNKGHDGFLGNSVLGEWCNLGADTNNSNLKNNYTEVRLWNYEAERFLSTGQQFCGLMMGDHSKCAINTMFNTGSLVGVNANIFGAGFPRNYIPSFSWGGSKRMITYKREKAYEVAEIVMKRRNIKLTKIDKRIMDHVFEITQKYRRA